MRPVILTTYNYETKYLGKVKHQICRLRLKKGIPSSFFQSYLTGVWCLLQEATKVFLRFCNLRRKAGEADVKGNLK